MDHVNSALIRKSLVKYALYSENWQIYFIQLAQFTSIVDKYFSDIVGFWQ